MKNVLINFAQNIWYESQKMCSVTGLDVGGFTDCIEHSFDDIDDMFKEKNAHILSHQRGAGYWLWKPYIILNTLRSLDPEDVLFYCDSGSFFTGSFNDYLFDLCREDEAGIILFKDEHLQKRYTKRDCVVYMDCDTENYLNNPQLVGGFQLARKTDFSIGFYEEALKWAQDDRILTDKPNECGKDNYPEFDDHRHDQSIFTNMQLKYNITTRADPSQWGNPRREEGYKQLINCHRINYNKDDIEYKILVD